MFAVQYVNAERIIFFHENKRFPDLLALEWTQNLHETEFNGKPYAYFYNVRKRMNKNLKKVEINVFVNVNT